VRSPALALVVAAVAFAADPPSQIHLTPGEYRWVPLHIKETPTEIDCTVTIVSGEPTVHAELLPLSEFRLFVRGQKHDTLAISREGARVEFRRIVDYRGDYAVVVKNRPGAGPVDLSFDVRTEVDPSSSAVAQTLPARRKLTVILISFAFFFVTVVWSGMKLTKAIRMSEDRLTER
jgi:hypothetical protein